MNPKMNHKIKIYDEVLKMFGIPHQKESPWYQDMFDKFCAIALHESAPVDGYDEKCYHECPNCNSRCNCNSQPCSCCSAPVDGYDEKCYHECPNCNSRCNCNSQPCSCCSAPVDDVVELREELGKIELGEDADGRSVYLKEDEYILEDVMRVINDFAPSRQPEIDALQKRVDELEKSNEILKRIYRSA